MNNKKIEYRWSDAWLLLSIAEASINHPVELWEIIAAGDAINHALFTDSELESGLCRLSSGGWIVEKMQKIRSLRKI